MYRVLRRPHGDHEAAVRSDVTSWGGSGDSKPMAKLTVLSHNTFPLLRTVPRRPWPLLFRLLSGQGITSLLRDRNPPVVKTASKACWQESCKWLHEGQSEYLIPLGALCAKCRNGTKVTNKCSRMAPGHHLLHPHSAVCFSKSALHIYSSWSHLSGRCSQFWEWEWN